MNLKKKCAKWKRNLGKEHHQIIKMERLKILHQEQIRQLSLEMNFHQI